MGARLSLSETADWCRSTATSLHAGIPLKQTLKRAAKEGRTPAQQVSQTILDRIELGDDVPGAMKHVANRFPPLLMAMVQVAYASGQLPEILKELERYFRFQIRLRRQFLAQITWPVLQLVMAILVIALVIFLLGILSSGSAQAADVLGLGLRGGSGAMIWLGGWMLLFGLLAGNYYLIREVFGRGQVVDSLLLRIPVLGPCLQTLALSRLCFAIRVTMDSPLSPHKAMQLSLDATGNYAYTGHKQEIAEAIRRGESLDRVFRDYPQLFRRDMVEVMEVAVEAGTVPESAGRLSDQYQEVAEHQLAALNQAAGWVVWTIVAGIIIFFIFRIFTTAYLNPLNDALRGLK